MPNIYKFTQKDKAGKVKNVGKMEIKNQTDSPNAELYFYGDIVSSTWGCWEKEDKCPQDVQDFLSSLDGTENIDIYINSGGGSVFAGLAIYNQLKRNPANKTVHVDGLAASIASVIALAGDTVIIPSTAQFMIHNPWMGLWGAYTADDFRKMADSLDACANTILNVYKENLADGVDISTIQELMNNEKWMTGDEAAQYFNINVEETTEAAACAGSEYFDKYKNTPKNLIKNITENPKNLQVEQQHIKNADTAEECICSNCNHSDNCQSSGAKCCICSNCDLVSQCSKPGANGCKCSYCTMSQNNCCQPGSNSCLCDTCPNQDCIKGNIASNSQSSNINTQMHNVNPIKSKEIEQLKAKLALELQL